jgi:hypothetical protein
VLYGHQDGAEICNLRKRSCFPFFVVCDMREQRLKLRHGRLQAMRVFVNGVAKP